MHSIVRSNQGFFQPLEQPALGWLARKVPTSITLKVLHDIIQAVMGWFDYHLWEFTIGKQKYGLPMDDEWETEPRIAAGKVRLRDVLKPRKTIIDYTYDFGDSWEHRLTVTDVRRRDEKTAEGQEDWRRPSTRLLSARLVASRLVVASRLG